MAFKNSFGVEMEGHKVVFPFVVKQGEQIKFLGSGFFIQQGGGFVTAKHNLYDGEKSIIDDLLIIDYRAEGEFHPRRISHVFKHKIADILLGMCSWDVRQPDVFIENDFLTMAKAQPKIGETVHTYAYPKNEVVKMEDGSFVGEFQPMYQFGEVVEYFPNGRDRTFLPGPCYQTTILVEGGSSGGPIFNQEGKVVGINSTGYEGVTPPVSFFTPISEIFEFRIPFVDNKSVLEMAEIGILAIK